MRGRPTVLDASAAQLREQLPPPFEAVAVRQGPQTWFLGGRRANVHGVELPDGLTATEITVAIGPDGGRSVLVDGDDPVELSGPFAEAVERFEAAGRSRQRAFVARAVRAGAPLEAHRRSSLTAGRATATLPPMAQNYGALEGILRMGEGRRLKRLAQQADYITSLEPDFESLSDEELAGKTIEFRQRLENGEPLDELVFEAFAAVREAARRAVGMRPFDVQLMGAIVLHEGDIAEMKTGEGKTLVATMPLYLNALPGDNVHLVTVNDYLAKRDAEWMGPVY